MTAQIEDVVVGKEPCPCGHRACDKWFLTGIGHFVQGSGFTEEEADRIIAALASLPSQDSFRAGIEAAAKVADEMREKHGSPTGDSYSNGTWDQGIRIAQQIRALTSPASSDRQTYCADTRCKKGSPHIQGSSGCFFGPASDDAFHETADPLKVTGELSTSVQGASPPVSGELREAEHVLKVALDAIETGRSEPLFIARDTIRNYFEDAAFSMKEDGR